ncbi:MAG: dehydratase [Solirubrobacterales bacterium]|jgi:acyl dehydratase|nr:dehydratase [Solirubrobacterales bacterium]
MASLTPQALRDSVGDTLGPTDWRTVTQDMIDTFATLSGDAQWIHTDVARAASESPYGTTIAHGNLTLSMVDGFRDELVPLAGFSLGVNLGYDRVRFPAPVPAGSRVRASAQVLAVDEREDGWWHIVQRFTVEVEPPAGQAPGRPVCVADSVIRARPAG